MKNIPYILCVLLMTSCIDIRKADLIVHNAVIYTADSVFNIRQAMAIRNGLIIETGTDDQILTKYAASTMIDAEKQAVYPGFIDAHCHFLHYGLDMDDVELTGTNSFKEVLHKVLVYASSHPDGWIVGRGWDQNDWKIKQLPDNHALDSLFPNRPVLLRRIDGHAALANSKALEMAGITVSTHIDGGIIGSRDGSLTGILLDNAADQLLGIIPPPSREKETRALLNAQKNCFSVGLTTVDDAGLDKDEVELIDKLQKSGDLKIRIYAMLNPNDENINHYQKSGIYITDKLSVRAFKFYADGALGSRGACLLQAYSDVADSVYYGFLLNSRQYLSDMAFKMNEAGFQMNTHCIGDSANRMMLNIYTGILKKGNNQRWRIEHCQVVDKEDIRKFGEYCILPSVQPTHATSDMPWAIDRLGADRIDNAYAYLSLLHQNNILPLGTDFPVEDINPVYTFYSAVFRKNKDGLPEKGYHIENALDRKQALLGMTRYAAYANFEEKMKGSLEAGKVADFVILNRDIMNAPEEEILKTRVIATYLSGEKVY